MRLLQRKTANERESLTPTLTQVVQMKGSKQGLSISESAKT
jgi:hypothetical protein